MTKLILLPILLLLWPVYYILFSGAPSLPVVDHNAWWGPEELKHNQDTSIRPFNIKFEEKMVKDLRHRLRNVRPLTPPLEGVGFQYGFNTNELKNWITYWAESYNFTEREREINKFQHYKTNIQGLDVHFIKIKPNVPQGVQIVPFLLLHGWPMSHVEYFDAIPHLTAVSEDRNFALEVVAPCLPGFGYSESARKPNFGPAEMAVVLRNLMRRLGFQQFVVQGGDWGSVTGSIIATLYPKEVLGFHTNMPITLTPRVLLTTALFSIFPSLLMSNEVIDRVYPLSEKMSLLLEESGYFHIQATKPDTVGVGMTDSPAGLLAYTMEKFSTGVNPEHRQLQDGGLNRFSKDKLLDNLMLYWISNSFTTSGRIYAEYSTRRMRSMHWDEVPTEVPTWALQAKYELTYLPPSILRWKYQNLLGTTVLPNGGHFLAFELPEVYAEDVLQAVGKFREFRKTRTEL